MVSFNLLHYPALASQRRRRHRWWTSLTGLAVGLAVAGWAAQELQALADQMQEDRTRLQAQLTDQTMQLQRLQKQQAVQKKWQLQSAHLAQLRQQHLTWLALYQSLQQAASPSSVQFLRLQLQAHQLELQGQARDVKRMEDARKRLSRSMSFPPGGNDKVHAEGQAGQTLQPVWVLSSLDTLFATGAASVTPATDPLEPHKAELSFVWQSVWPLEVVSSASAKTEAPTGVVKEAP